MSDLTLIIPAKNEQESLPKVLDELMKFNFKKNIILESSDKPTIEAIRIYDCKIIYQESKGYGDALKKGIETVETEFFCIFNADGSFNPKELDIMIKKIKNDKFFILNPDTVWGKNYKKDFYRLEKTYFRYKKPVMLLVSKKKSFDKSFKGDFNINNKKQIFKSYKNNYIYTGAQLVDKSFFKGKKIKSFPMSIVWKKLIKKKEILAELSDNSFFHVNSLKTYKKLCKKKLLI